MKQVFQNINSGETIVENVPVPTLVAGQVLIESRKSLVSAGTERMLVEFGQSGYLGKARQQPEKVKEVLGKIASNGLLETYKAVKAKLDQPLAMGYSNVGVVTEVGPGVAGLQVGDRVVSNGYHADFVVVGENLCAKVPNGVDDDTAAFAVVGAIALQGIRLMVPTIGERFVVIGLGLIGLLAVQILRANGCRVLGIDIDSSKLKLAALFGADVMSAESSLNNVQAAEVFSQGDGVDGVLITASSKSDEVIHDAATMCRKRGRIVLVGIVGLSLRRSDFYEKELTFQVSCSYGPGRYDPTYENEGYDYPLPYVRWTEQRNFQAILDLMQARQVVTQDLVSGKFVVSEAVRAYKLLQESPTTMGILIDYDTMKAQTKSTGRTIALNPAPKRVSGSTAIVIGAIGAGNYASRMLLPAFARTDNRLRMIVTLGGSSAATIGRRLGFDKASTDVNDIYEDGEVNLLVIATRHDSHAAYVLRALAAGKHVFVEKPLCLTLEELAQIEDATTESSSILMVGFNRRFSPLIVKAQELLATTSAPKSLNMTVNAGAIPAGHWTRNPEVGGGRIVGEACHFVDLLRHLAGAPITAASITSVRPGDTAPSIAESALISLKFADGSIGAIQYLTNGNNQFPKERLEVFAEGKVLRLDNFRKLEGWGWKGFRKQKLWRQDKGQQACVNAVLAAVQRGDPSPIPVEELLEVSRVSIELAEAAR